MVDVLLADRGHRVHVRHRIDRDLVAVVDPQDDRVITARMELGAMLRDQGRLEEAATQFRKATEMPLPTSFQRFIPNLHAWTPADREELAALFDLGMVNMLHYLLSRGLCGVLNLLFGMSSRDNKSGFFMCRREVLRDLLAFQGSYRHWQCFVMVAAHHRGYRWAAVGVADAGASVRVRGHQHQRGGIPRQSAIDS